MVPESIDFATCALFLTMSTHLTLHKKGHWRRLNLPSVDRFNMLCCWLTHTKRHSPGGVSDLHLIQTHACDRGPSCWCISAIACT